ncbi:hypothetical protein TrCOL_g13427 [Triparma columacea]|uniref:Ubiquitin carboxyl-terminal hydrolase n=1 Tax=Triparma columacea TaxID=722753 RepID=A0A9W7GDS4_9STRA|nr:hypothetical protein TrCOL_g13427 [Triparma columacea]
MVNWFPLESNPEVLTTYSSSLGLKSSYVFSDLVALEDWAFAMLPGKCEAVVFLYSLSQPQREYHDNFIPPEGRDSTSSLFRVQQNVGNACGTIGVLHSIGSVRSKYSDCLEEGSWFETFFNKCEGKTGAENGALLEADEEIETKHTSAANSSANSSAQVASADSNVNEHFVAFVEHNGGVYEMDGRRGGGEGLFHGKGGLSEVVGRVCQEYMARDPSSNKFSLVALCKVD